jgi:hypothetical protein
LIAGYYRVFVNRSKCATNLINAYDFNIPTYLDNMNDDLQNLFSAWPFRYYLIKTNPTEPAIIYRFSYIPSPAESEFDISQIKEFDSS